MGVLLPGAGTHRWRQAAARQAQTFRRSILADVDVDAARGVTSRGQQQRLGGRGSETSAAAAGSVCFPLPAVPHPTRSRAKDSEECLRQGAAHHRLRTGALLIRW